MSEESQCSMLTRPRLLQWPVFLTIREVEGVSTSILDTAAHSDGLDGNIIRVEVGLAMFCVTLFRRVG